MSASEIADYVSFRNALRKLHVLEGKKGFIDVERNLDYFKAVEEGIVRLQVYSEIAGMEKARLVREYAASGKVAGGLFQGGKRNSMLEGIHSELPHVLHNADALVAAKRPPTNLAAKGRMIDIIKRLAYLKENIPKVPEGKSLYSNARELFLGPHGLVYCELSGILAEIKAVDPPAEAEDEYAKTATLLNPLIYKYGDNEAEIKLKNLVPAMASCEALLTARRRCYDIVDSDFGPSEELRQARQQRDAAYERLLEIEKRLGQQPVRILPKSEDDLETLDKLQKRLMQHIGANDQATHVRVTVDAAIGPMQRLLFSNLDGNTELPTRDQDSIKEAWDLSKGLYTLKGDATLSQSHKDVIQELSNHIRETIASKGYVSRA